MEGVAIVLAGAAVVWLILWILRNDNRQSIGEQIGLFRMLDRVSGDRGEDTTEEPGAN